MLFDFVMRALRRASYKWPARNIAKKDARVARGQYRCNKCEGIFRVKEVEVDHIVPVIPLSGTKSFDVIIPRLFCDSNNLQVLCKKCHREKSKGENKLRFEYRKPRK